MIRVMYTNYLLHMSNGFEDIASARKCYADRLEKTSMPLQLVSSLCMVHSSSVSYEQQALKRYDVFMERNAKEVCRPQQLIHKSIQMLQSLEHVMLVEDIVSERVLKWFYMTSGRYKWYVFS